MKKILAEWLAWFGVAVGALSAISAFVRILDIGLSGIWAEAVAFYRKLISPLYELVQLIPFPIEIPNLAVDLLAVYFVTFMASFRAALLPLADKENLDFERMRDARKYQKIMPDEPKDWPENTIMAIKNQDNTYTVHLYEYKPVAFTWIKWALLTITLWPALSLSPMRRTPLRDFLFSKKLKSAPMKHNNKTGFLEFDGGMVSKKALEQTKYYMYLTVQIILVPVAVVLFFLLAEYSPF